VNRLAAAVVACAAALARADEGMWMPEQVPQLAPRLRELGFSGDAKAFADLTGDPMGAIVSLGGCSGSFVSPDGLVATNHHCVIGALQTNATPERNLIRDGFVARSRGEELWAGPGSRVLVTLSVKDVTGAIAAPIDPKLDDAARGKLLERRVKERTAACERGGVRCTIASFFEGARWLEIAQLELQDVRLVLAPPEAVGNFGGETDNWSWPRHAGDFAFVRAYVSRDGQPVAHAKDNVPYRPTRYLRVSPRGVSEGALVLVAGYPGRTQRLRTLAEVRGELEWAYPRTVRRNRELIAALEPIAKADPAAAIRVHAKLRSLANGMKNREGVIAGAARVGLLEAKATDEKELRAFIAADPPRKAAYGAALPGLDRLEEERERTRERDATFEALLSSSGLLDAARTIARLAEERPKEDLERDAEFQAREWPKLRERLERLERTYDARADRALLRYVLVEAAALPEALRIAPLDAAIGITPGTSAQEASRRIDALLGRLYAGTRLHEKAIRVALLEASARDLARRNDAFLALYGALRPFERELDEARHAREGARSRFGPVYAKALIDRAAGLVAPDANRTLRVTYGVVKGVSPRDGVVYAPQTRLSGVVAKHRPGDAEFGIPPSVLEIMRAQVARRSGPWVDPKLGDVPVDFLSTVDTTGGSSGSAVLNDQGELVGLLFDGTWETVASDFLYDRDATRSIQVDSRYVLWFLSDVARAKGLLRELGVDARVGAR
jgi:Peptidase S46